MLGKQDWFTYGLGIASFSLSLFAVFFEPDQISMIILLIVGVAGLVVFIVFLYKNKLENLQQDLNSLKKEYKFTEQIIKIKQEISNLKNE